MMLTIGAIVLFGIFLSVTNKVMIWNNQIASQNEYYVTAISLAQSVIDEAKTKAYDEKTIGQDSMVDATKLTASGSLGRDAGESTFNLPDTSSKNAPFTAAYPGYASANVYDDVDDYNGYRRLVNTPRAEGYQISATVRYGDPVNPNASSGRSYCKVMTVKVTSPYFRNKYETESHQQDTLTLQYAFTY